MIVDPFTIYMINRLAEAKEILPDIACSVGIAFFLLLLLHFIESIALEDISLISKPKLKISILATIAISLYLVSWLIPTKEEMYTLFILSKVTPENLAIMQNFGVQDFQDFCDSIANSIDKIQSR